MRSSQHARVITGTAAKPLRYPIEPNARNKMPLLFYLPLIIWMGMVEVAQEEMCAPVKVGARTTPR